MAWNKSFSRLLKGIMVPPESIKSNSFTAFFRGFCITICRQPPLLQVLSTVPLMSSSVSGMSSLLENCLNLRNAIWNCLLSRTLSSRKSRYFLAPTTAKADW